MPSLHDETGKRYGRLTVIERAENRITPSGHQRTMWKCLCDCGKETVVDAQALTKGTTLSCSCLGVERRKKAVQNNKESLDGKKFGRLLVVKETDPHVSPTGKTRRKWLCLCDCGNYVEVLGESLKKGTTQSCGCLKHDSDKFHVSNLVGKKFGELTVLNRGPNIRLNSRTTLVTWDCVCTCGKTINVRASNLRTGNTKSCGCIGASNGEHLISQYLDSVGISYSREVNFDDLKTSNGGYPRFDFAIFDEDSKITALIEIQGLQHYVPRKNSDFGQFQREETDRIKREYCSAHNIPLYEIRYDEDHIGRIKEIINMLHVNPVPRLSNE